MSMNLLGEFMVNGIMLGVMYSLVAVGFSLFFGVLNVINFSHGDVVTAGGFLALVVAAIAAPVLSNLEALQVLAVLLAVCGLLALLGVVVGRVFVLPMRDAPPINVLLMTLMLGTALREAIRLFYPDGTNPQAFPRLLPTEDLALVGLRIRIDVLILFTLGAAAIIAVDLLLRKTRLGLSIRAVAQDAETAELMGMNFKWIVGATFALGSALAGVAGIMHGLYYSEINFNVGLLLGVIGFASAVLGGLGSVWGAILGAFVFSFLQTLWVVAYPGESGYKTAFAFGVVIILMTLRPTGLIAERQSART